MESGLSDTPPKRPLLRFLKYLKTVEYSRPISFIRHPRNIGTCFTSISGTLKRREIIGKLAALTFIIPENHFAVNLSTRCGKQYVVKFRARQNQFIFDMTINIIGQGHKGANPSIALCTSTVDYFSNEKRKGDGSILVK